MNAPAIYFVRFWVNPASHKKVFDYLDQVHLKDVVSQPGFLWARRYKLSQVNADGWPGYQMIYALESLPALETYFGSAASKRYREEAAKLGLLDESVVKMERVWGGLDAAVDR